MSLPGLRDKKATKKKKRKNDISVAHPWSSNNVSSDVDNQFLNLILATTFNLLLISLSLIYLVENLNFNVHFYERKDLRGQLCLGYLLGKQYSST